MFEFLPIAQQGFEVVDSIASRGRASLVAVSFVVAGYALIRTAFRRNFEFTAIFATALVGGFMIWLVSGGYSILGDVVENEAENISQDIRE